MKASLLLLALVLLAGCRPPEKIAKVEEDAGPSPAEECLTRLKRISQGMVMYAADSDDRMPFADRWMDADMPYVKMQEAFQCPTVQSEDPNGFGFAFNSALSGISITSDPSPAKTPMLYDSTKKERNANDPQSSLPKPGRHDGKNNVAHLDGHADPTSN